MYGAMSSSSGRRTDTYARPSSNAEASICDTRPNSGISFGATLARDFRKSRGTCPSPPAPARRGVDLRPAPELGHLLRRDVGPRLPEVARDVHQPVVAPGPDHV